jgi:hypothetical protein
MDSDVVANKRELEGGFLTAMCKYHPPTDDAQFSLNYYSMLFGPLTSRGVHGDRHSDVHALGPERTMEVVMQVIWEQLTATGQRTCPVLQRKRLS